MNPRRRDFQHGSRLQRGFTIVAAIFLLVVLAALGAFIVAVSTTSSISSALDVQGARAYQAARAGVEWGVYQVNGSTPTPFDATNPNGRSCTFSSTGTNLSIPTGTTLTPFTVTVKCTQYPSPYPDANNSPKVFEVEATACNQPSVAGICPGTPSANYVERRLRVSF